MYQPPRISKESIYGLAVVKINPDRTRVRAILTRKDKSGQETTTTTYDLPRSECPPYLKPGTWSVKMSPDGKKMYSAIPSEATVVCQFKGLAHKEGEDPTPQPATSQWGDYLKFTAILVVVEGEFTGLEIPVFLRYNFDPIEDKDGNRVVAYSGFGKNAVHTPYLDSLLTPLGVWEKGPMKHSDNILPVIQKRAKSKAEEGRKIVVGLSKGFANAFRAWTDVESWDEDAEEDVSVPQDGGSEVEPPFTPDAEPDPDDETHNEAPDEGGDEEISGDWAN